MKLDEIKELARIFGKSKLDKMKIKMKDFELEMEKGGTVQAVTVAAPVAAEPVATPAPAATPQGATPSVEAEAKAAAPKGDIITSPMVGTFYASPSPDAPPFVQVGDTVKKGQTLCILEAMKIMNELEAEYDCKILDILVQDGEAVEYDKPLFVVKKL
jgi:acetyl-CoA carboxylase biotin carboxyl carrier protein